MTQWTDVTGSVPLRLVDGCVSFTSVVSARYTRLSLCVRLSVCLYVSMSVCLRQSQRSQARLITWGSFASDFGFENRSCQWLCQGETSSFEIVMSDDVTLWSKLESYMVSKSTRFLADR